MYAQRRSFHACVCVCGPHGAHRQRWQPEVKSFSFLIGLNGYPRSAAGISGLDRGACHVFLMPFSFRGCDWGTAVLSCMQVCVWPLKSFPFKTLPGLTSARQEIRACDGESWSPEAAAL